VPGSGSVLSEIRTLPRISASAGKALEEIKEVDLLLRRAILARIAGKYDDDKWKELSRAARVGEIPVNLDPH
jgi:hypothetical protein